METELTNHLIKNSLIYLDDQIAKYQFYVILRTFVIEFFKIFIKRLFDIIDFHFSENIDTKQIYLEILVFIQLVARCSFTAESLKTLGGQLSWSLAEFLWS